MRNRVDEEEESEIELSTSEVSEEDNVIQTAENGKVRFCRRCRYEFLIRRGIWEINQN